MRRLSLGFDPDRPPVVLCLGAHCDDIEIGCGGTLLRLLEARPDVQVHWVVLTSTPERRAEALRGAEHFLGAGRMSGVAIENFRDGFLPWEGARVKEYFEQLKVRIRPDLILTHWREDRHQDHRVLSDLTWNTWRDHLILEYEIPKYDGDLGQPAAFVDLDEYHVQRKLDAVLDAYASQSAKPWFAEDTLRALMRLRGVECNAAGRHAEAFFARKLVLTP